MTTLFPKCSIEVLPEQDVINNIITATEAGDMVDNLTNNWFGQLIVYGRQAVVKAGKSITSFDDAAKAVGEVVDKFKRMVLNEIEARDRESVKKLTSEEAEERKQHSIKLRGRIDNSLRSGKSVVTNALKHGEIILSTVDDGGHVLFRKDGTPRGKTELQNLIKKAKHDSSPKKSEVEQALDAAVHLARKMVPLSPADRKMVMASLTSKVKEFDAERDEIEVEEPMAEAA